MRAAMEDELIPGLEMVLPCLRRRFGFPRGLRLRSAGKPDI